MPNVHCPGRGVEVVARLDVTQLKLLSRYIYNNFIIY